MGKRIDNPKFENCLKKDRIRKFSQGRALVKKEIKAAEEVINLAKEFLNLTKKIILEK